MIFHFFIIVFSIFIIEIINFSQFFKKINFCIFIIKKIQKLILSKKISDHWKEKAILNYSKQLMLNSLKVLGVLVFVIFIYFVISYFYHPFSNFFFSIKGIIEITIIIILYLFLRKLIYAKL